MTTHEPEELIEQVTSAWRPTDPRSGGRRGHPAFYDLDPAGREVAFRETVAQRRLEAALDPDGLSTTAHAVLAAIRGT